MSDQPAPDATAFSPADSYVSDTEHQLLSDGLHRYFSVPERGPERNRILEELTQQLSALRPSWTCRTLRVWFNNTKRLFADVVTPGDSPKPLSNPNSEYASAIMDAAFRLMMFDEPIALSFINSLLHEANKDFPTLTHVSLTEIEARYREPGRPPLNFRGDTSDGQKLIIEIKPRAEMLYEEVAMFRAGSVWTRDGPMFSEDVEDLYSLRLVDCGRWEGSGMTDCNGLGGPSVMLDMGGMLVVDVKLRRADVTFPVADEVGRPWNAAQWWYYLLNFSQNFTDAEIARYERLGMPAAVLAGARKLKRSAWRSEVEESYRNEIEGVDAALEARLEPQLRGLIDVFRSNGRLVDADLEKVTETFSVDFVRRMWYIYGDGRDTDLYLVFLAVLRGMGLINE